MSDKKNESITGFVIRERGAPRPFASKAEKPHQPLFYTYSVKVVYGHHVTKNLTGTRDDAARVYETRRQAEAMLKTIGRERWVVISMETALRDQGELDAENVERREKRERWEAAVADVAEAERIALATLRGDPLYDVTSAKNRLERADRELAAALRGDPR